MPRVLVRDPRRGVLGGVASGFGEYLDVDPVFVRIGFVLLTFAHGVGPLLYAACWILVPARTVTGAPPSGEPLPGSDAPRSPAAPDATAAQLVIGAALVVGGALLLAHNLDWLHWPHWLRLGTLWPLALVALGLGLIVRSRRGQTA